MTDTRIIKVVAALNRASARLHLHVRELALRIGAASPARDCGPEWAGLLRDSRRSRASKVLLASGAVAGVLVLGLGLLWLRLGAGPLPLDIATPWITAALEERFGGRHRITVGGTQLERDDDGRTAVRLRDVVVSDAHGSVVASAPKAEVGIAATWIIGNLRTERLSLIGAEMAVRIQKDGEVVVFAGSDRPLVAAAGAEGLSGNDPRTTGTSASRSMRADAAEYRVANADTPNGTPKGANDPVLLPALLNWLQNLDAVGLDGHDLMEIGLRNGSIAVDDRRNGRQLTFGNINLSVTRPKEGGIALAVSSMGTDGLWSLNATVTPRANGLRAIEAVVRDVSPKDVMLALRVDNSDFSADLPISAVFRVEIDAENRIQTAEGRMIAGAGYIGDPNDATARVLIDEANVELRWDAANRTFIAPTEISSGANRIALTAQIKPPAEPGGVWAFAVAEGKFSLAGAPQSRDPPFVLDRIRMQASYDPGTRKVVMSEGDFRGPTGFVTATATVDCSGPQARLISAVNFSPMPAYAFKRLWPVLIKAPVRTYVEERILSGQVERVAIATNATLLELKPGGPPLRDEGLSIDIVSKGVTIRPVEGLPAIRDADVVGRISGRKATITIGKGTADLPSGKKLAITGAVFEVPETQMDEPPARVRFRIEGGLESALELVSADLLRESAKLPFENSGVKGNVSAQVTVGLPIRKGIPKSSVIYGVDADITGFAAERFIRGHKGEAALLKLSASPAALQIKGDAKIAGTPASIDYRRGRNDADAEIRAQMTLDDGARSRLGLDFGGALIGPVVIKVAGKLKGEHDTRLGIEADLTQARINDPFSGWTKAAGRSSKAAFSIVDKGQSIRLEDVVLDGSGAQVRGSVEVDTDGNLMQADFSKFALSDGDKASLKAERASDGTLKVNLRGDVYDGRGLIKSTVAGQKPEQRAKRAGTDLDLDVKVGALTGHHGEALRGLELRMSRRGGQIRSFALNGRLGQDAPIAGDLRGKAGGQQIIQVETADAGALFRFSDIYPRLQGGRMLLQMEPPSLDPAPQDGLLTISDFSIRGETALERVAASGPGIQTDRNGGSITGAVSGVSFSRMRVDFARTPGRFIVKDGVVWGPAMGATVDGHLDYGRDEVRLRGTFVPAYALNNMFGRIPIVGLFLGGGSNEGLLGITYQVVGTPTAPTLQVNPISAIAPGFLRKLFEFRSVNEQTTTRPPEAIR